MARVDVVAKGGVTMVFDFSLMPPEVNSTLIYSGAGSSSLLVAAKAWENLSQDLQASAMSFGSVLAELATGPWAGPAAEAMSAAAAPYVSWLSSASAQAAASAGHAAASAAAFEVAQSAMVHPALVTANRSTLLALVASNLLGQNTPAIAATEAHYMEMWAQDVAAMVGYHGNALSVASGMTTFSPAPTGLPGLGAVAASAASSSTGHAGVGGLLGGISSLLSPLMSSLTSGAGVEGLSSVVEMGMYPISMMMSPIMSLAQMARPAAAAASLAGSTSVTGDAPKLVGDVKPMGGGMGAGALAGLGGHGGLGQARLVGDVSVPASWPGSMPGKMASSAMMGLGAAGAPAAEEMAAAAGGARPMPMPMPMPMGGGGGMAGGPLGRGGASPHVMQNRPSVIPRTGV